MSDNKSVDNEAYQGDQEEKAEDAAPPSDVNEDCSRFSEDGMETEIEVSIDDDDQDSQKKKKKNKKKKRESSPEYAKDPEKNALEDKTEDDAESASNDSKSLKKKNFKNKVKRFRSAPLLLFLACKISVILPIAIYSCDVILSVNVLENNSIEMLKNLNDTWKARISIEPFLTVGYSHKYQGTTLKLIEHIARSSDWQKKLSQGFSRTTRNFMTTQSFTSSNVSDLTNTTTTIPTHDNSTQTSTIITTATTLIPTPDNSTQTSTTIGTTTTNFTDNVTVTTSNSTQQQSQTFTTNTTTATVTTKYMNITTDQQLNKTLFASTTESMTTTNSELDITTVEQTTAKVLIDFKNKGQQCYNIYYFINVHKEWDEKHKSDWFESMKGPLSQIQQTLFYMYTIIGFFFLMSSIVMRFEIFLNQKWSSFLIFIFILYSISTALTAHAFYLQSSNYGLRCFLCRMFPNCQDINPWDLSMQGYFPSFGVNWTLVAFLSYIFKMYDCIAFGFITLYFILDFKSDAVWLIILKIFGWVVAFPLMIFTPSAGVFAFQVLPATGFGGTSVSLALTIIFGIGCGIWALFLIWLPIFCKMRMCNDNGDDDDEDEY